MRSRIQSNSFVFAFVASALLVSDTSTAGTNENGDWVVDSASVFHHVFPEAVTFTREASLPVETSFPGSVFPVRTRKAAPKLLQLRGQKPYVILHHPRLRSSVGMGGQDVFFLRYEMFFGNNSDEKFRAVCSNFIRTPVENVSSGYVAHIGIQKGATMDIDEEGREVLGISQPEKKNLANIVAELHCVLHELPKPPPFDG